jgi:lipid-A-disaccharide synthase-like uncharacterized protein
VDRQRNPAGKRDPRGILVVSITGGITLLGYAIWRQDPVFITGQAFGLLVYARNLVLIKRKSAQDDTHLKKPATA